MNQRVLILCTGNSCRSQMAEGLWRRLGGQGWEVQSAGTQPAGYVHPLAVEAMRQLGIDISGHTSKHVDQVAASPFDLVVTVCDSAQQACPTLPGARRVEHWPFADPALASGSHPERLARFAQVRDQIRARIAQFLADG